MDKNTQTLQVYENHADFYEKDTLADFRNNPEKAKKIIQTQQEFLKKSLENIPVSASLFEIGSGYGRDARFIRSLGYNIQTSDAVDSFIARLRRDDFNPVKFNLITDDFSQKWDYILANAVLVHFPKDKVESALKKVHGALHSGGVFAFSVKQKLGGGEDWKTDIAGEKRYFSYWEEGEIEQLVRELGFEVVFIKQIGGIRACWLDVVVKK